MTSAIDANGLLAISRLFSYPDAQTISAPAPEGVGAEVQALFAKRGQIAPIRLENEYVRLFINALPEVPCPPYGSVYLEGTLMGVSTIQLSDIYRKYGLIPEEMPDHIAVECEFLAWLSEKSRDSQEARLDFDFLLHHLQEWICPFLTRVVQHDQLGWYGQCAEWAKGYFTTA